MAPKKSNGGASRNNKPKTESTSTNQGPSNATPPVRESAPPATSAILWASAAQPTGQVNPLSLSLYQQIDSLLASSHQSLAKGGGGPMPRFQSLLPEFKEIVSEVCRLEAEQQSHAATRTQLEKCKVWLRQLIKGIAESDPQGLATVVAEVSDAGWVLQEGGEDMDVDT